MTETNEAKRVCVFCGREKVTREHVWPDWLGRELSKRYTDLKFEAVRGGVKRTSPVIDAVVKRVCKTCNEGWMARIEDAAKPLLLPMMFAERSVVVISPQDQAIIATWALKTALMNDFYGKASAFAPPVHRQLFEANKPGSNCRVKIAAYGGRNLRLATYASPVTMTVREHFSPAGILLREPIRMRGGLSTARLVHLVLQVLVFDRDDLAIPLYRSDAAFDRVIWPVDRVSITWPPAGESLDDDAILSYAEGTGRFRRAKARPVEGTLLKVTPPSSG